MDQQLVPTFFEEQADKIGPNTRLAIDEILRLRVYPEQAYRSCVGVLSFAKRYTAQRLENACERALYYIHISATLIKSILDRELDRIKLVDEEITDTDPDGTPRAVIPLHDNIRGADSYQ